MSIVRRETRKGKVFWVALRFGGRVVWERAGNDGRAAEKLERKRKREIKLGTYIPPARRHTETVAGFAAAWLAKRTVRSVRDERRWLELHVLSRPWFASMKLGDVESVHVEQLVAEMRTVPREPTAREAAKGAMPKLPTDKSISNITGVLHVMFEDAARARLMHGRNPANLPRRMLKRDRASEPVIYTPSEIRTLTRNEAIPVVDRVLLALLFFAGLREGEAAGRRWRDVDGGPSPLACLDVRDQYDGRPMKTDPGNREGKPCRPRVVPIHPELAGILEAWLPQWQLLVGRPPLPTDFIVPHVSTRTGKQHHTRSTAHKAFKRACRAAGIPARTLHATRHTFITLCRRGCTADGEKVVEKITHNAKGTIVDRYTHRAWDELCSVVLSMALDDLAVSGRQHLQLPPGSSGGNGGIQTSTGSTETPSLTSKPRDDSEFDSRRLHSASAPKDLGRPTRSNNALTDASSAFARMHSDADSEGADFLSAVVEHGARATAAALRRPLPAGVRVALFRREVAHAG